MRAEQDDKRRMVVEKVRDGTGLDGVPPRVEVAPEPSRQPARTCEGIPELWPTLDVNGTKVDDERLTVLSAQCCHDPRLPDPGGGWLSWLHRRGACETGSAGRPAAEHTLLHIALLGESRHCRIGQGHLPIS